MNERKTPDVLLWLDLETTGIETSGHVLEVAAIATEFDRELTPIGEPFERVLRMPNIHLRDLDPTVLEMHAASGLWRDCLRSDLTDERLANDFHHQCHRWGLWSGPTVHLAGRSVHFDRAWAEVHFPDAFRFVSLSHRHFDLTSIRAFATLAGIKFSVKEDAHRALADVQADIAVALSLLQAGM